VPLEIGKQILEQDLAAEALAEEGDVGPDHWTQVH
jgi:hypothetical protein